MNLSPGIYHATHRPTGDTFMLSVVKDRHGVVTGVAAFHVGRKRPSRKVHYLIAGMVALWLAELDITAVRPHVINGEGK